jgi:GTP-binding protein
MDVRHPLTVGDNLMLDWCQHRRFPVHVLLSKTDKLARGRALEVLRKVVPALEKTGAPVSVQLFSATGRLGLDEAYAKLSRWLDLDHGDQDQRRR